MALWSGLNVARVSAGCWRDMNIRARLSHGFFFIFTGRVGGGLLTILITPIVVRILGTGGYGDYAFAMAVYSVLRTIAGGGVYEGARKHIAETADPDEQSSTFRVYLSVSVLFGSRCAHPARDNVRRGGHGYPRVSTARIPLHRRTPRRLSRVLSPRPECVDGLRARTILGTALCAQSRGSLISRSVPSGSRKCATRIPHPGWSCGCVTNATSSRKRS